jgi:nifR3 family TIM-barrel protein
MNKKDIWQRLPRGFTVLAPMEDVTDTVYRQLIARYARPHVFFTEFCSTDGLCSKGNEAVKHRLEFTEIERPIIAQIWGAKPEKFFATAKELQDRNFDGIDINMGCPVAKIVKNGACSALIDNPNLAAEIIQATAEGAPELAISVKTRLGFKTIKTESWSNFLLAQPIQALTIHGRLAKDLSTKPADWSEIKKVVEQKNKINSNIIIIGNGDVLSLEDADKKIEFSGVDGVMIGRAIFDNLFVFNDQLKPLKERSPKEKLELLLEHLELHKQYWKNRKPSKLLKKFFRNYAIGFDGASQLRDALVNADVESEVAQLTHDFLNKD